MVSTLKFYDFQMFEFLVWAFLVLGLMRVLFELFDLRKFDRYSEKLNRGGGIGGFLIAFVLLGPVAMYIAADFEFASSSKARDLIIWSPRAFLCLEGILFGWATAFSAEGLLFMVWLIFRRKQRLVSNSS
jgi:hypothetical protein